MAGFPPAARLVFRVMAGEWLETLWDCMEVSGPGSCLAFYTPMVLLGNLLMLNLFLGLLLGSAHFALLTAPPEGGAQDLQALVGRTWIWVRGRVRSLVWRNPSGGSREEFLDLTEVTTGQRPPLRDPGS
ncbi:sodium channel protein type 4 subunit alpha B-like isoform 1-T2 [Menidia menidia]